MHTLLERVARLERRHPTLAINLCLKLEQAFQEHNEVAHQLDALYLRFFILEHLGEAQNVADSIYNGLHIAQQSNLPAQAAKMLLALGRISYTRGVYRESIRFWTNCIDVCKFTDDIDTIVEARIGLGQIYDALGDWETGARFHFDAGSLLANLDKPYLQSKQAINLGVNQFNNGRLDIAQTAFAHGLQEAERGGIREYVAEAYWHLGLIDKAKLQYADALDKVQTALRLGHACGYLWLEGVALQTLAELYVLQGKAGEAITAYQTALEHANKIGSRHQQSTSMGALSELSEQAGQLEQALRYAREHQRIQSELNRLNTEDRFRDISTYDLSKKPPIEQLLDLSSDRRLEENDVDSSLQFIAESALQALRIDFVGIYLIDPAGTDIAMRAQIFSDSAAPAVPDINKQANPAWFATLTHTSGPHTIHDVRLHGAAADVTRYFAAFPIRSLLEIPLRLNGSYTGNVLFAQTGQQRNWSRDDVLFGSHIGHLVQQVLAQQQNYLAKLELEGRVAHRTKELSERTRDLQLAQKNIARLNEIGREITSSLNLETIIPVLRTRIQEFVEVDFFSLAIYHPAKEQIEFRYTYVDGRRIDDTRIGVSDDDSLAAYCLQHATDIIVNDTEEDLQLYAPVGNTGKMHFTDPATNRPVLFNSQIWIPLIIKKQAIGLLCVQNRASHSFEKKHVDVLKTLASYTSIAVDNANTLMQLAQAEKNLITQEKLASLGSMVAGVAHELNTPIGNCIMTASMLHDSSDLYLKKVAAGSLVKSEFKDFLHTIRESNELLMRNLKSATDLIASFKQVSADQASEQQRVFNLLQTTREVVRTLQHQIKKTGHRIEIDIADDISLDSFPGPYGQIITNFINNSLLHAFDDKLRGTMWIKARRIGTDQVEIVFSDDGVGISPQYLGRVFDPFFTTKLGQGGSGLGMSIVHNLVTHLMQGSIVLKSIPANGTQITMTLPLKI